VTWSFADGDRAILDAVTARLIPTDETGPGAREARVVEYIERSLATNYEQHRAAYGAGLSALGAAGFAELPADRQDAVLADLDRRDDDFLALVRQHAIEGMFCDPVWGGNAGRVGWRLLGYPGPRHVWTETDQELDAEPGPVEAD
jgi:gluconate 2-dehydrogenase gamma chain